MFRIHSRRLMLAALIVAAPTQYLLAQARQGAARVPAASDESQLSPDEQQIRQGVIRFVELYNSHQASDIAQLFAPDGRMIFRDGTQVDGREAIQQSFEDAFAASPKTAVSVTVQGIRFLTPDVAVEEGETSLFPDGETLTSVGRYTVLHVKKEGRWLMQSARTVEEESRSAYGELQALELSGERTRETSSRAREIAAQARAIGEDARVAGATLPTTPPVVPPAVE